MSDRAQEALNIVSEELCVPVCNLQPETKLEDLHMDSLDALSIVHELEHKLGIKLGKMTPRSDTTVADLLQTVEQAPPSV